MGRIVVNKHFAHSRDIEPEKFVNLGEIIISNEPGFEGLYILNTDGQKVKIGGGSEGPSDVPEDIKAWIQERYLSKSETNDLVSGVSAATAAEIVNLSANTVAAINAIASDNEAVNNLSAATVSELSGIDSRLSDVENKDTVTHNEAAEIAAVEVAKIVASADTKYDTLKEIADWIANDTEGSAQMMQDIVALKAISADTRLDKIESFDSKAYTDDVAQSAKSYTDSLIEALEERLEELIRKQTATGDHLTLTEAQYQALVSGSSVVIDGIEYTYDDKTYYCIKEEQEKPIDTGGTINVEVREDGALIIDGVNITDDGTVVLENAEVLPDGTLVFKASSNADAEMDEENSILALFGSGITVNEDGAIVLPSTAKVVNNTIILN